MSNFLEEFKGIISRGFSSFFSGEKQSAAIGIDIGSSSIKVVELKKKGSKVALSTYGALALGPYAGTDVATVTNLPTDILAKALIDVMKESNVVTRSGALSIPSSASLIFIISLPGTVSENDLKNIIPVEARKYIPVPIAEVSMDYWVLPNQVVSENESTPDNVPQSNSNPNSLVASTDVLVVAIHNDTLAKYRDLLTSSSIESTFFEMEVFSSIRSTFNYELEPVLFLDFGASKTRVFIIEYGIVKAFHVINRGGADMTKNIATVFNIGFKDAEQSKRSIGLTQGGNPQVVEIIKTSIDYILSDANTIVQGFQKKYNKGISKVVLVGGGSMMIGLRERVSEIFAVNVEYGDPFSKVEAPAFLAPILKQSGPEFAVSVGIALRQLL